MSLEQRQIQTGHGIAVGRFDARSEVSNPSWISSSQKWFSHAVYSRH